MYTDITNPDSHPFVRKCWDMPLAGLSDYHNHLVEKFNGLYEQAFDDVEMGYAEGFASDSQTWELAEEWEEKANIADEVYCHRQELQDTLGDVAPTG